MTPLLFSVALLLFCSLPSICHYLPSSSLNSVSPWKVFDMQTHVGHTSILFKKRNYHRPKVSNSPKILLTSVIIHPLTEHGRFNLLPKGILKSGDLISSALHCQSCQVQRARRKERLLSRPSGGAEGRTGEKSGAGREGGGMEWSWMKIRYFVSESHLTAEERVHFRGRYIAAGNENTDSTPRTFSTVSTSV